MDCQWYNRLMQNFLLKRKNAQKKKKESVRLAAHGGFARLFILVFSVMWALLISGPSRLHEEKQAQTIRVIEENVQGIQGIEENIFEYVTYQGYTTDTLYWFDQTGQVITERSMDTLDYNKARQMALDTYQMEAESVELAFGYTSPVYEIKSRDRLLMLDYDTFEKVYER